MPRDLEALARDLAIPYYEAALPAHDRFHARRVRDLSIRLADEYDESVDREVLAAAAWLHDVGRPLERTGAIDDHGDWGASEAAVLFDDEGVPADRIDAVARCVRAHSIRASSPDPTTPEAKLLFDADKLDAAGAVGLVRLACIVGERSGRAGEKYAAIDGPSVRDSAGRADDVGPEGDDVGGPAVSLLREWARERLDALHTPPARRLGESRWDFLKAFFERFEREVGPGAEL